MGSLFIGTIQNNRLLFLILLLVYSLASLFIPQGLIEATEHDDYEGILRQPLDNKPTENIRRLIKKFSSVLHKIFRLPRILSVTFALVNIRIVFFNLGICKASILRLRSVLCSCFHGGKYKQINYTSYFLPLT